tara:strand:+ start:4624 stop:6258 length:1635 start_codon:yes stop_codon:yes gene_type:complete
MPIYSYDRYEADGSTTIFSITINYLSETHLKIYIDGVLQTTGYTLDPSTNRVTFTSAPTAGSIVVIQRNTPKTKALYQEEIVDFQDGSVLSEEDLDNAVLGLLYITQEAEDAGNTNALSYDLVKNAYNAARGDVSQRISNVATPTDTLDAVTKQYVDSKVLYNAPSAPQTWTLNGDGATSAFTLDPSPVSTDVTMFIVDVDGVIQKPTTDFTISGSTITFESSPAPPSGTGNITVRNFGVARDIIASPIQPGSLEEVALTVKGVSGQTGDLQQWQDSSGAALAKIKSDGDAEVADLQVTGNADVDGTLTVDGSTTLTGGISGDLTITGGTTTGALAASGDVSINTNKLTIQASSGNLQGAGTILTTGNITSSGGDIIATGGNLSGNLVMNSNKITGLQTPTAGSTDAATAAYVDSVVAPDDLLKIYAACSFEVQTYGNTITVQNFTNFGNVSSVVGTYYTNGDRYRMVVTFTNSIPHGTNIRICGVNDAYPLRNFGETFTGSNSDTYRCDKVDTNKIKIVSTTYNNDGGYDRFDLMVIGTTLGV